MNKQAVLDSLDFRAFYRGLIPSLTGESQGSGRCPFHEDQRASLSVNLDSGLWRCHAGCGEGNAIGFYMRMKGVDFKTALRELGEITGLKKGAYAQMKEVKAVYDYKDENGALLYQVVRYEPKDFRPRHRGPNESWIYDLQGVRRVPYNLPELVNANGAVLVEGEKDANNLKALGYAGNTAVTTSQGGAKAWKPEYADYFLSKQVAIIPDNDRPGLEYAETVARSLQGKASVIRIVELPGLGERKEKQGLDVSDWIELKRKEGRTDREIKGELARLIKETPAWEPKEDSPQKEYSGLVMLDTVTPESISWLWEGRIPLGKLSLIDGDPGLGKSTVTLDLVARVSREDSMPDGSPGVSGGAVLLTLEDGLADTIVPRLKAAGADLSRIASLQAVHDKDGKPRLPTVEDIEAIKISCHKVQAKIVVIDPLMAHLDGRTNSFRDQDIRRALTPLAQLADEIGVAVVVVRHLNKASGGQAIYRGGGSIGIAGQARCTHLVAKDPEDEGRRIFAGIKNNLAPMPPSLSFSLEGVDGASRIVWGGISSHGADALLAIPSSPEERTALDEAKDFLKDLLANGPVDSRRAQKEAKAAGITDVTLRRARKALNINAEKQGFKGGWAWVLPEDAQEVPKMLIQNDEHLRGQMSTFAQNEPVTVLAVIE